MKRQNLVFAGVGAFSIAMAGGAFFLGRARAGAAPEAVTAAPAAAPLDRALNEPIMAIKPAAQLDTRKVRLGKALFNDVRLSGDNSLSCNSCHALNAGGADSRARSLGVRGSEGEINSPTVLNSSLNFKQFWDGRADSLEMQVDGPIHNPKEMDTSWPEIVGKLSADATFSKDFTASYPEGFKPETIRDALATFERSLTTPNSRFDRYLSGDQKALSEDEVKGYRAFKELGCITCHQGMNAGGNMFQPFGLMADYFADRGDETKADLGRFNVTGLPQDRHRFKVPGLRNVELTAPYFHDGSARTLEDAVRVMAKYQLAQPIEEEQVRLMVTFLKTLTGEQPSP